MKKTHDWNHTARQVQRIIKELQEINRKTTGGIERVDAFNQRMNEAVHLLVAASERATTLAEGPGELLQWLNANEGKHVTEIDRDAMLKLDWEGYWPLFNDHDRLVALAVHGGDGECLDSSGKRSNRSWTPADLEGDELVPVPEAAYADFTTTKRSRS